MANSKWSQLPSGSPAQTTDVVAVARSGSNFKLFLSDIVALFAAAFPFSALTTGSNTQAAMTVGTGASLGRSGSGTIDASAIGGVAITGTPTAGNVPTATGGSAATWQAPAGLSVIGTSGITKIQAGRASVNNGGTVTFPTAFTTLIAVTLGNYSGSANIASSSTTGFVMNTSSSPQQIDWIAVGT